LAAHEDDNWSKPIKIYDKEAVYSKVDVKDFWWLRDLKNFMRHGNTTALLLNSQQLVLNIKRDDFEIEES